MPYMMHFSAPRWGVGNAQAAAQGAALPSCTGLQGSVYQHPHGTCLQCQKVRERHEISQNIKLLRKCNYVTAFFLEFIRSAGLIEE